ncbi:MAG: cbb3-type cytochrome c oxidase subunit I [Chloroflexi bacterium]|nr:cbb3-type cytochrome c oxidase subunit I [Chloroflexota bacterium]
MPRIVRVYIRASLVWLLLGMAAFAGHSAGWLPAAWFPVYLHMLTYGWLTQLVFGMGMWMFPLLRRDHPRGDDRWNWAAWVTLNVGLALRVVFEPWGQAPGRRAALVTSALLLWLAAVFFTRNAWPRLRLKPRPARPRAARASTSPKERG